MFDLLILLAQDENPIMRERLMASAVGVAPMTTHAYRAMQFSIDKKYSKAEFAVILD